MQSTRWIFVINNPTAEEQVVLRNLGDDVGTNGLRYLVWGREIGETGTYHLQGFVVFDSRKRLRTVKEIIGHRAHCEVARGTSVQAADYAKKDGDYDEFGNLPTGRRQAESVTDFADWVRQQLSEGVAVNERSIANAFPTLFVRYGARLVVLANHLPPPPVMEINDLRGWQIDLYQELLLPADDRKVKFFVNAEGGAGKTFFCRWMLTAHNDLVQVLSVGKRDDLAHAIDTTKKIFLFNIPRASMEFFQYGIAEGLKDKMVFSPKYNSMMKILTQNVHVVVFSNEHPNREKLSRDRFDIQEI